MFGGPVGVLEACPGLSYEIYFSSYYKFEGKHLVMNIFNILQNLFSWSDITNVVYSKLGTGTCRLRSGYSKIFVIRLLR
jgi:hypothetical protein